MSLPSPLPTPSYPTISPRYHVIRALGRGSVGEVFLVEDAIRREQVALKLLRVEHLVGGVFGDRDLGRGDSGRGSAGRGDSGGGNAEGGDSGSGGLRSLREEFRALSHFRHPQLSRVFDFGYTTQHGLPYFTREYVKGRPLEPGPPAPGQSLRSHLAPILDVLDALHYLHVHDQLHLDIHSGNVIAADDASRGAVLIDPSFRRFVDLRSTRGPSSSDSPPELFEPNDIGPATDLFYTGRLLLFRLLGLTDPSRPFPATLPGCDARQCLALERLVRKALQRDPGSRFQCAAEFQRALRKVIGEPRSSQPTIEPREEIHGRNPVLKLVDTCLRRSLEENRLQFVGFSGAAGLGKSRLLREVRIRSQLLGVDVIEARFLEGGRADPVVRLAIEQSLPKQEAERWQLHFRAERSGSTSDRARRAVFALLQETTLPPLTLIVDDVERADRESREILQALVEESRRTRGGPAGRSVSVFFAARDPKSVTLPGVQRLKPLKAREARALLVALVRPLTLRTPLVNRIAEEARGNPLRLRRAARYLQRKYDATTLPLDLKRLPPIAFLERTAPETSVGDWAPDRRWLLETMASIGRPSTCSEIALAAERPVVSVESFLEELVDDEFLVGQDSEAELVYYFSRPEVAAMFRAGVPRRRQRRIHQALVDDLAPQTPLSERMQENLARHRLMVGPKAEARECVLRTAERLVDAGRHQNAIGLLRHALQLETASGAITHRVVLAERCSEICDATGDHGEGVEVLQPLVDEATALPKRLRLRLTRRLAVHLHREGMTDRAEQVFEELRELSRRCRVMEERVFVESELAELYTFVGDYDRAEAACRAGLDQLASVAQASRPKPEAYPEDFLQRMRVTLHATLGHIELRRLRLEDACRHLQEALSLATGVGLRPLKALVLNNLGITHNHADRFAEARRSLDLAEEILERDGDLRPLLQLSCNRALISAKTGASDVAVRSLLRARSVYETHPDRRNRFFLRYAEATVAFWLGDTEGVLEHGSAAIPAGNDVGDAHLVRHVEGWMSGAQIASALYGTAARSLKRLLRTCRSAPHASLQRIVLVQDLLNRQLTGQSSAARRLSAELQASTPETASFLECWLQLGIAAAEVIGGRPPPESLVETRERLDRFGAVPGRHLSTLLLLVGDLRAGKTGAIRERLAELNGEPPAAHHVVAVLHGVFLAEAYLALGELDSVETSLDAAASAIVGFSFPELDGRIEFLRARLAERRGDRSGARQLVHRALNTRNLMAQSLPERARPRFLHQERFKELEALSKHLEKPAPTAPTTPTGGRAAQFCDLVGASAPMQEVYELVRKLRDVEIPVLIQGETGTGKELVARAIHQNSPRRDGRFFALHCASLSPELVESELLGYESGAFTGADSARPGILEHLQGGTLLLDEVSSLAPEAQAKLLRIIETPTLRRLGGVDERPLDVRFLASTSEDLRNLLGVDRFRKDLFFRLRGAEITLPPLRRRGGDLLTLLQHFLRRQSTRFEREVPVLEEGCERVLESYDWPGNVRELEATVTQAILLTSPGKPISAGTFEPLLKATEAEPLVTEEQVEHRDLESLRNELERVFLRSRFRRHGGDVRALAAELGMKPVSVYVWFRRVGLDVRELRRGDV